MRPATALLALAATAMLGLSGCGSVQGIAEPVPSVPTLELAAPTSSISSTSKKKPKRKPSGTTTPTTTTTTQAQPDGSGTTTRRPSTGFPTADSTGVPNGTKLTAVTGDKTFSADGQTISGKDFRGFVRVTGSNVTIKNSIFRGRATSTNAALLDTEDGSGTVVQDSEFVPAQPSATIDGIWARNTKLYRVHVHGGVDGIKAQSNTLVQDSYIHDMDWFSSDPNQGGGETHNDGVQSFAFESNVTLRHNTIDMSTTKNGNAAWQSSAKNSVAERNYLDGGGCSLNFDHKPLNGPLTGIVIRDNRFGRHQFYKCGVILSTQSQLAAYSGNVWHDTGTPIPPPERHD